MELIKLKNEANKNDIYLSNIENTERNEYIEKKIVTLSEILLSILIILLLFYILKNLIINNTRDYSHFDLKNFTDTNSSFNESILNPYIQRQKDFCINPLKYYNSEFENNIKLHKVIFKDINFNMYIHKGQDIVSKSIVNSKYYEPDETNNILNALKYYGRKYNIQNNTDIYVLDIGGNIGWYPYILGEFNYSILTFEPQEKNYYILRKNFCLINNNSNIIIINKGLSNDERNCSFYKDIDNIGNGMAIYDDIKNSDMKLEFEKTGEVSLTKLSNFIPYFYGKYLALIKIDIEGLEGKAIEGGIELINKFHVPFILLEFTPRALIEHGTNPKKFLKLFVDNGYKIKIRGFFEQTNVSVNEVMKMVKELINLYIIYEKYDEY